MNVLATQARAPRTARRCSRTSRLGARPRSTLITGALVREAERLGVPAPLHTALYRLVKAKEAGYS